MTTKRVIGGIICIMLVGFLIATMFMSIFLAFTVSPFWWIAASGNATGIVLTALAALTFLGSNDK